MPARLEILVAEALQLSAAERAQLVERLIRSLDMDPEVEEAWVAEVERRNAELESGRVSPLPGAETLAGLKFGLTVGAVEADGFPIEARVEMLLSSDTGQRNDGMGKFVAEKTVKLMIERGFGVKGAHVNILGLSYKENCPDLRNSRVPDIVRELRSCGVEVHVHDPVALAAAAEREYGMALVGWDELPRADALILAVAHRALCRIAAQTLVDKVRPGGCVVDVNACLDRQVLERAGLRVWRL